MAAKKAARKRGKKRAPKRAKASAPTGRPTLYSVKLAERLCELKSQGYTLNQIGDMPGFPCKSTVCNWLRKIPGFMDLYVRAREVEAEMMADEIIDIVDDNRNDWVERENTRTGQTYIALNEEAIARSRARAEFRMRLMPKLNAKRFADRLKLGDTAPGSKDESQERAYVLIPAKVAPSDEPIG